MVEPSRSVDLAEEPLRAKRRGQLGPQHLDGDFAMVLQVLGEVDRRHTAATEFTLDRVAVGKRGLQSGEQVSQ